MLILLLRKIWSAFIYTRTNNILIALLMVFFGSWAGMVITEGTDSCFANPIDYLYYFTVTLSTVGYGDISPETLPGKFIAVLLIISGIGLSAVILSRVANLVYLFSLKRIKGFMTTKANNHIVLLFSGQNLETITQMVVEILADENHADACIIVGSDNQDHNGILHDKRISNKRVEFKYSEKIHNSQMFERTNITKATKVVVYSAEDSQTVFTSLAVHQINPDCYIVAVLRHNENAQYCYNISDNIECVTPIQDLVAVQEVQDPGIASVLVSLLKNTEGSSVYRVDIPNDAPERTLGECMNLLLEQKRAYLIAVGNCKINPGADYIIKGGMWLYVSAPERPVGIVW